MATNQSHQEMYLVAADIPACPEAARAMGMGGTVVLDAVIGRDGRVLSLSFREGDPVFAESAMQTVRHWEYRPTKLNGVPIEVATEIELNFSDAAR
jgi:TonB family protein